MAAFNCPKCKDGKMKVTDSRAENPRGVQAIRRRRQCLSCGYRFTSYELFSGDPSPDVHGLQAEVDIPGWTMLSKIQRSTIRSVVSALAAQNDA